MIYVGYPCIGKTSISSKNTGYIDLESSNFEKTENWADSYVKTAIDLSNQGYNVFVSSHKNVREALKTHGATFICIFPALELKDVWLDRAYKRHVKSKGKEHAKNNSAVVRVFKYYEDDINDLMKEQNIAIITENAFKNKHIVKYAQKYKLCEEPPWIDGPYVYKETIIDEYGNRVIESEDWDFDLLQFMNSIVAYNELLV